MEVQVYEFNPFCISVLQTDYQENNRKKIIESNISAPAFDIIDFAQELGLSRTSLFNKIKSLTGMTPNNFMIDIKLKHAASCLKKNPNENVSNIAYACGFNTLSHFNKLFKKTYGLTPSEYRNSNK